MVHKMQKLAWMGCMGICLACQSKDKDAKDLERIMRMGEKIQQNQGTIAFYGKVVDQYGKPVEGVEVEFHVRRHGTNPQTFFLAVDDYRLKTDNNGKFNFTGKMGLGCGVYGLFKRGYEYDRSRTMADFERLLEESPYSRPEAPHSVNFEYGHRPRASNPATPSVFYLRKLGETTHVLLREAFFPFEPKGSGTEKGYDFISDILIDEKRFRTMQFNNDPITCDLKILAIQDPKTQAWSVVLSSGTVDGGVLLTDQFLYEAPKEGYQPSLTLGPDPKSPKARCLFIRSRFPFIYTRLDLGQEFGVEGKPFVRAKGGTRTTFVFGGSATVNPYGERNLEEDKELPSQVSSKLENEIRASYRINTNGRPPKPDLPKLVEEWKKNRPVVERVKEIFKR